MNRSLVQRKFIQFDFLHLSFHLNVRPTYYMLKVWQYWQSLFLGMWCSQFTFSLSYASGVLFWVFPRAVYTRLLNPPFFHFCRFVVCSFRFVIHSVDEIPFILSFRNVGLLDFVRAVMLSTSSFHMPAYTLQSSWASPPVSDQLRFSYIVRLKPFVNEATIIYLLVRQPLLTCLRTTMRVNLTEVYTWII